MDKESGEVLEAVDKVFTTVISKEHYIPGTEITMPEFKIDSSAYGEKTLVVFEKLFRCEGTKGNYTIIDVRP